MPGLFEEFNEGEGVLIILVGEHAWQVGRAGEGWLEAIHDSWDALMPIDLEFVEDVRRPPH